jgi:hypothetical protein
MGVIGAPDEGWDPTWTLVRFYVLMQSEQQRRDGDHRDCRADMDRAGCTGDVDVVLTGDDKDVGAIGRAAVAQMGSTAKITVVVK